MGDQQISPSSAFCSQQIRWSPTTWGGQSTDSNVKLIQKYPHRHTHKQWLTWAPMVQSCWHIKLTITFPYTFIGTFKIIIYLHCLLFQLLRLCKKLSQDMWFKTIATYSLFMNLQLGQMLARRAPLNSTLVSAVMLRLFKSLLTLMSGWQWVSRWDNEHELIGYGFFGWPKPPYSTWARFQD